MKRIFTLFISLIIIISPLRCYAVSTAARAAVLICADTGEVIHSENSGERLPMASTTKIMTALILCEYGNLDREIIVTKKMVTVEGSSMGLLPGDKVTLHDLLYGMLLASGNDAANVTAYIIGGSPQKFAVIMNERAKKMGLKDTHFVTPSGLDSNEHYTTAYELSMIAREALKNKDFAAAAASPKAILNYGNPPYRRTLTNHNRLLSYDDVIGVKTGFTKKSGRCLVSAAKSENGTVIAVTLHDPDDWADHRALLDYGLSKVKKVDIKPAKSKISIPIFGGITDSVSAEASQNSICVSDESRLKFSVRNTGRVYAPVKKGDTVGFIDCVYNDKCILSVPLIAKQGVAARKPSIFKRYMSIMKYMISLMN